MSKIISKTLCTEKSELLRTKESYSLDIEQNDASVTGLKESCVWHAIDNFHFTQNIAVDIMHDVFEGVCNYTLCPILYRYIVDYKLFNLETLNFRIQTFLYGELEKGNKPPIITMDNLKKITYECA